MLDILSKGRLLVGFGRGAAKLEYDGFRVPMNEARERFIESAEVVVRDHIINQRLIPNAMEPRAVLAQYSSGMGELTLWAATQNPHIARFLLSLDTGIPEHKIRVIAPEVGGGFGSKIPHYPEDSMAVFASKTLNRPVKWTEGRSENYRATIHGRDHDGQARIAR